MSYICKTCGKIVEDSEKFGSGKFCSRSCANKRNHSEETKENIRKGVLKETICECQFCGKPFKNLTAKASHERLCEKNSDRLANAGAEARKNISAKANYKVRNGDILDVSNEFIYEYLETHITCEICGKTIEESCHWDSKFKPKRLCVDHDHKTLKFRGVLCSQCNRQLGWYELYKKEIESYLNK